MYYFLPFNRLLIERYFILGERYKKYPIRESNNP